MQLYESGGVVFQSIRQRYSHSKWLSEVDENEAGNATPAITKKIPSIRLNLSTGQMVITNRILFTMFLMLRAMDTEDPDRLGGSLKVNNLGSGTLKMAASPAATTSLAAPPSQS